MIANSLLSGDRSANGCYPIEGGYSQSKRIPQGINVGNKVTPKLTDIALPLMARDYKGIANQKQTAVIVYEED